MSTLLISTCWSCATVFDVDDWLGSCILWWWYCSTMSSVALCLFGMIHGCLAWCDMSAFVRRPPTHKIPLSDLMGHNFRKRFDFRCSSWNAFCWVWWTIAASASRSSLTDKDLTAKVFASVSLRALMRNSRFAWRIQATALFSAYHDE